MIKCIRIFIPVYEIAVNFHTLFMKLLWIYIPCLCVYDNLPWNRYPVYERYSPKGTLFGRTSPVRSLDPRRLFFLCGVLIRARSARGLVSSGQVSSTNITTNASSEKAPERFVDIVIQAKGEPRLSGHRLSGLFGWTFIRTFQFSPKFKSNLCIFIIHVFDYPDIFH